MIQLETSSQLSHREPDIDTAIADQVTGGNALVSKADMLLQDNEMRVECVWILGGAKACEHTPVLAAVSSDISAGGQDLLDAHNGRVMYSPRLGAGDTYCTGVAVDLLKPDQQGVSHIRDDSRIDSKNMFWAVNTDKDVSQEWRKVIDRFLSLSDANLRFQDSLESAREKFRNEHSELGDAAPRTISQVRKDNQENKDRGNIVKDGHAPSPNDLGVQGISDQGVLAGEVIMAIGWVAHCGGSLRRGIHITDALPVLDAVPSRPSSVAADFVMVQIHREHETIKLRRGDTAVIPVTLALTSTSSTDLIVDIEAMDTFLLKRGNNATSQGANSAAQNASGVGNDIFSPNVPVKGIKWEGKLRYKSITLPAFDTVSLKFMAIVTRPGLYDLKK